MRKIVLYLLLLIGQATHGQNIPTVSARPSATPVTVPSAYGNINVNFVRTWEPYAPATDTSWVSAPARTVGEVKMNTEYMDGLGRTIQVVQKSQSPNGYDLVTPTIYDAYGREQYKYLPYVSSTTDGKFNVDPFNGQKTFYQGTMPGESIYYTQTTYEASPLNRVLKSYAAGNSWASTGGNRPVENQYLINSAGDSVRLWSMSAGIPVTAGNYAAGTLKKDVTIDEVGNKVITYKDKNEHLVLKKVQLLATPGTGHTGWLCTYYVYDDLENLCAVIPPLGVERARQSGWNVSSVLNELCYVYQYDERKRMIVKRVPGAGPVYVVYDVRDRVVFTQDSMQRASSPQQWLVNFYDNLDRPVMTAIYKANTTRAALQNSMNTAISNTQSITNTFPVIQDLVLNEYDGSSSYTAGRSILFSPGFDSDSGATFVAAIDSSGTGGAVTVSASNPLPSISADALTPLTYTFYDNYNFTGKQDYLSSDISKPQAGSNPNAEALPGSPSAKTKGLTTGKRMRVLGTDQWLTSTMYYNDKGRVIQALSDNHTGGRDVVTTLYDFNGKVLSTYLRHKNPRSSLTAQTTVLTMLSYDDAGRLLNTVKRLNDNTAQDRIISANAYNELGQLQRKRLHVNGAGQLDSLSFLYDIRGSLTGINKAYVNAAGGANWFGEELSYEDGFTSNQYNGNIAGVKWKSQSDGITRSYGYGYDNVGRLTRADFTQQNTSGAAWTADKMDFSVSNLSYDPNGNIGSLRQKGMIGATIGLVDQLKYTYQAGSNKLMAVTDTANTKAAKLGDFNDGTTTTGNDYAYNGNGALIADSNKAISAISYNHLNLPVSISVAGKGTVSFLYDANGTKLQKTVTDNTVSPAQTTVTDYVEGFVYKQDTLQFLSQEEGRIRPLYVAGRPVNFTYDYFEKDHLGNIRVVLGTKSDTAVYAATMETAAAAVENALFSNIDNTRAAKPNGYPADNTTSPNDYVAKLNGVNGQKIGPSLVLRVMAGDSITVVSRALYKNTGASTSGSTSSSMVNAILQAFSGSTVSDGVHGGTGSSSPITFLTTGIYDGLKSKDPDQDITTMPKAYLNFASFDDQFNLVDENSGVRQVKGAVDSLITLVVNKMAIKKTGFIYIYESNESGQDVYFDNLIVTHNSGPLLEETHYYPFGLTMAGISSNALKGNNYDENKKKYNGNELQSNEFSDGSGLDLFDFNARTYDQQLGRFLEIDPWIEVGSQEMQSPYHFSYNNPIRYNDPDGKCPICPALPFVPEIVEGLAALGAATGITGLVLKTLDKISNGDISFPTGGAIEHMGPSFMVRTVEDNSQGAKTPKNSKPSLPSTDQTSQSAAQDPGSPNSNNSGNTGNKQESKQRNKPNQTGTPNSSSIDAKDASGKTTKYSTYDENGNLIKQVEGDRGVPRHGVPGATKKVPTTNTLPDGTVKPGKLKILPATPQETPPGNNLRN